MRDLRRELGRALERSMPEPEAALAKGMLLGQRDGIPKDVEEEFNDAGISHLIVISGANVMLVAGFVVGALRSVAGRETGDPRGDGGSRCVCAVCGWFAAGVAGCRDGDRSPGRRAVWAWRVQPRRGVAAA